MTDIDDLVDEIETIRGRLGATVDELVERASPKSIVSHTLENVKANFVDETGSPRMERIVPIVAGVAAVVVGMIALRRLTR